MSGPKRKLRRKRVTMYNVVSEAVHVGLEVGWRRAHKHTETPSPEHVRDCTERAIMEQLDEVVEL